MAAVNTIGGLPEAISPAEHAFLVTPADGADLAFVSRGIRISADGALKVTTLGGDTLVYPSGALAPGICHPMRVTRVWSTSTTATGIVAEY